MQDPLRLTDVDLGYRRDRPGHDNDRMNRANAWVIRSGRQGERDQWALANSFSGGGWREVPDITACANREDVAKVVGATWPGASDGRRNNLTGQLWALRSRIQPGDLLAMPLKTTKQIAIGRVTR
jgi:restriction system protein